MTLPHLVLPARRLRPPISSLSVLNVAKGVTAAPAMARIRLFRVADRSWGESGVVDSLRLPR